GAPAVPGGFNPGGAPPAAGLSPNYLTLKPRLKAMLDRVETNAPFLFSLAIDLNHGDDDDNEFEYQLQNTPVKLRTAGLAFHWPGGKDRMLALAAIDCSNDQHAGTLRSEMDQVMGQLNGNPRVLLANLLLARATGIKAPPIRIRTGP